MKQQSLWNRIAKAKYIYILLLPGVLYFLLFSYGPMYGLLLAFKKYNARLGILFSPWVGMKNFRRLFISPEFFTALINTLEISFGRLIFEFPFPIILALLLNEAKDGGMKRVYQVLYTFPHFLSWIIVSSILMTFLGNNGAVNAIIRSMGSPSVNFLSSPRLFRVLLYATSMWKGAGWSSIIYMAAIAGIDPTLYEAAIMDGAGRLRRIWHVTLPGITPTIIVLFIMAVGNVMNGGFDQIFNLQNPVVRPLSEIIDTYVYRISFQTAPDFGFSTAVGMFKSVINLMLLFVANGVVRKISGQGMFG